MRQAYSCFNSIALVPHRAFSSFAELIHDILNSKVDPNWHPLRPEVYASLKPKNRLIYRLIREPFWWTGTILNWWNQLTLDSSKVSSKDRSKVRTSVAVVVIFAAVFFPALIATTGI